MKKITILLVIIFTFLFSTTSWGEWSYVTESGNGNKFYYDIDRVRKNKRTLYFWELINLLKPYNGIWSVTTYIELDCSIFRSKSLKRQSYENSMGEGEMKNEWTPKNEWMYPKPNSTREYVYNKICEKLVGEKTEIVVNGNEKGVLYNRKVNGEWGWYKSGDDKNNIKYEGEIENGLPNGQGKITGPDGSEYEGEFKDGRQNGQGKFVIFKGGEILLKYFGEFKNDFPNGQGTTTLFSGGEIVEKYIGEHKNNRYHGQGSKTNKDGSTYIGEFKDGKRNGQGTKNFPDGRMIIGEYKEGKLDGQGTVTLANGRKFVGGFRKDKPWNVKVYDKKGNIIGEYMNGKEQ